MLLALTGSYQELLPFITFGSALFGGVTVLALYWLRISRPDLPRPYRCWGYPVTPALYLVICAAFLIYVVQGKPLATGLGLLLMLSGVPFYAAWKRRAGTSAE
jgi:APA family basic amino acid/polyamine antiporter